MTTTIIDPLALSVEALVPVGGDDGDEDDDGAGAARNQ
jgi:hypothetical protein